MALGTGSREESHEGSWTDRGGWSSQGAFWSQIMDPHGPAMNLFGPVNHIAAIRPGITLITAMRSATHPGHRSLNCAGMDAWLGIVHPCEFTQGGAGLL
jgi:hypothetical protein